MPLDFHRSYDYARPGDHTLLSEHVASWPAVRAAGQLVFVFKYGVLASGLRIAATVAVFALIGILAGGGTGIDIPSLGVLLILVWLVGLATFGTLHGVRLWDWQERLYHYAVTERGRETEIAMAQQQASTTEPWHVTLHADGRAHLYFDPSDGEPKDGLGAPDT